MKKLFLFLFCLVPMFGFCVMFEFNWEVKNPNFNQEGNKQNVSLDGITLKDVCKVALIAVDENRTVVKDGVADIRPDEVIFTTEKTGVWNPPGVKSTEGFYSYSFAGGVGGAGGNGTFYSPDYNLDPNKKYHMVMEDSNGKAYVSNAMKVNQLFVSANQSGREYKLTEEGWMEFQNDGQGWRHADIGDSPWRADGYMKGGVLTKLPYTGPDLTGDKDNSLYWQHGVSQIVPEPAVAVSLLLGLSALLLKRRNPVV